MMVSPHPPAARSLPLNDELAVDRTALANERTLLAYLRTALQRLVAAVSLLRFVRFFDDALAVALGWALVPWAAC